MSPKAASSASTTVTPTPSDQGSSNGSTVDSAPWRASATSTAPSSANSADSTPTTTASASNGSTLKDWFEANPSKISKYLHGRKPSDTASPADSSEIAGIVKSFCEGVQVVKGPNGEDQIVTSIVMHGQFGDREVTLQGLDGHPDHTIEFHWGPAAGKNTTFNFGTGAGTTSVPKTTMPSLDPYLKRKWPKSPEKPEWYKSWKPQTAKGAPEMEFADWDLDYKTVEILKAGKKYDATSSANFDAYGKVILDAIRTCTAPNDGTEPSIRADFYPTAVMYDSAVQNSAAESLIASEMASAAVDSLYNDRAVPLSVKEQETLRNTMEKGFTNAFDNPDPSPTTYNGLGTHDATLVMMDEDGKPRPVLDEQTRMGRQVQLERFRWELYDKFGATRSWQDCTRYAGWLLDNYHARGPHISKDGYGVTTQELLSEVESRIEAGEGPPTEYPQSLIDAVEARRAAGTADRTSLGSSPSRPSKKSNRTGPQPRPVDSHIGSRSTSKSAETEATQAKKLRGTANFSKALSSLNPSQRAAFDDFLKGFGPKGRETNDFGSNGFGATHLGGTAVSVGA